MIPLSFTVIMWWLYCLFFQAFALFSLASLISYSAYDASFFYDDTVLSQLHNWMGYLGASYASLVLYYFGFSAWLLVPCFSIMGIYFAGIRTWSGADRFLGLVLLLVANATFCKYLMYEPYTGNDAGGFLGSLVQRYLASSISNVFVERSVIVMCLLISAVLIFRFSWAGHVSRCWSLFSGVISSWRISAALYNGYKLGITKMACLYKKIRYVDNYQEEQALERMLRDSINETSTSVDTLDLYKDPVWKRAGTQQKEPAPQHQSSLFVPSLTVPSPTVPSISKAYTKDDSKAVEYDLPNLSLLNASHENTATKTQESHRERGRLLEEKLEHFGIHGKITSIVHGPTVTLFEYQPRIDMKISSIIAREDDLALALRALSLRIIAPIPGTSVIGFEVANEHREPVYFYDCMRGYNALSSREKLPLVLGKDAAGNSYVTDLSALPHLLVAGSTGSGKSVGLHTMIMSLLYYLSYDDLKLILIDPKRIEFSPFADLPHLLFPVQTQAQSAIRVLEWCVRTMEERYDLMARQEARNIHDYHAQYGKEAMPFIVIIIDELADLMMTGGKDCEEIITRLAQMSRAAGMHLIAATQRPSVDVITGLIKVNFPARISFKVASKIDSRTILDISGAEKLLSKGDMLFLNPHGMVRRIQGAFISTQEINNVVSFIKSQRPPEYVVLAQSVTQTVNNDEDNALYTEVRAFLKNVDEVSISLLQRKFRIGYNRSARIFDRLESEGLIAPADGGKLRRVMKNLTESSNASIKE